MSVKEETVKILEGFDGEANVKRMLNNIIRSIHIIEHEAWERGYRECHKSHLKSLDNIGVKKMEANNE
jgi:hypothetical protein